jgi:hypothetical protein
VTKPPTILMGTAPTATCIAPKFGISTDIGGKLIQQDAYIALENLFTHDGKSAHLYAVCDGHGTTYSLRYIHLTQVPTDTRLHRSSKSGSEILSLISKTT